MAKLQSTENVSREMQQQSTEMLSHKRLCKRNRLFSGSWRTRQRRGVLLLVSLVLLVMFLMLGVTFVLTAGNFRRSSEAYQRMLERPSADLPERSGDLLDSVAHDLVRGTSNPDSPFAKENLLEDLYGRPALRGRLTSDPILRQLTDLEVAVDADFTPSAGRDYYAGLVLTMLTGDCAGKSTRIVGSQWNALTSKLTLSVVDFSGSDSPNGDDSATPELDGDLFMVNGRPFSGDGSESASSGRQLNEDYDKADAKNPWLFSRDASGEITSDTASFAKQTNWNADSRPVTITHDDGSTTQVVVDNDGDGEKDSVWMDVGLPLQLQPDGSYVKPLVAMMVRDLDGRVNLNAHGSMEEMRDSQDTMGTGRLGLGYGPAEIDPKFIFFPEDTYTSEHVRKIENFVCRRRNAELSMPPPPSGADGGGSYDTSEYDSSDSSDPEYLIEATASDALNDFLQFGSAPQDLITPIDPHGLTQVDDSLKNSDGSINLQQMYIPDAGHSKALEGDFGTNPYEKQLDTADDIVHSHDPYTPEQLERVLRFADADADAIDPRLAHDLAPLGITGPDQLKMIRDLITTESWDLPVAGLAWPQGLSGQLTDTPTAGHITDLFAARFKKEDSSITDDVARQRAAALMVQLDPSNPFDTNANPPTPRYVDADGNLIDQTEDDWEEKIVRRGLISPGLTRGTRLNVNRLFGNGVDDDKDDPNAPGYDVVDDVGEVGTETITAPGYGGIKFDHDGDGNPGQPNDKRARQHYAQQLYLLLMLLSDGLEGQSCFTDVTSGSDEQRRLLARRLAQFAVNAVDYRDPDSIMTGFEYDADPFDATGWDSDGNIATDESNDGLDNDGNGTPDDETAGSDLDRGIVWGCEAPVAALSGTLALHDLRLKDLSVGGETTALAAGSTFPPNAEDYGNPATLNALILADPDYDQYGPPEGSLFLQVYALPQPSGAKLPAEFFNGGSRDLELSKTTPSSNDPVWRVVISEPHVAGKTQQGTSGAGAPIVNQLRDQGAEATDVTGVSSVWSPLTTLLPDATNPLQLQFQAPGVASNTNVDPTIALDRVIYFANPPSTTPTLNQAYVANTLVSLAPGSAIHLGPRHNTNIRQAGIVQNTVSCDVVCEVDSPGTWNGGLGKVGMSISEPVVSSYYNDSALSRVSGVLDPSAEDYSAPANTPFDKTNATPVGKLIAATPSLLESDRIEPVGTMSDTAGGMNQIAVHRPQIGGTLQNYATAFLQRLADPTQAYDATSNPYLTVDLMPIDLTVYNGDGVAQAAAVINQPGTSGITIANPVYAEHLGTDERGWRNRATLNDPVGSATKNMSISAPSSFVSSSNPAPFWPNRPFVSQYELLMVPASEPGKLALEMGTHKDSPDTNFSAGFPHLLNFFFQSSSEPQLGRVFDYLHVPSKFAGTQVSLDPGSLSEVPGFAPPFNVISTYREPGRVNLNTIEDSEVWKAVMHGEPSSDDPKSHQGPVHLNLQDTYHGSGEVSASAGTTVAMPLLSSSLGFEGTDTNNPFLRYQPINRMGNLVTNRSNVYAVWMTLGFFETKSDGDLVPGPVEAGGSGLERHRAFYMIDRSIPVGYENGHDHNTEDVFRVKRYIE